MHRITTLTALAALTLCLGTACDTSEDLELDALDELELELEIDVELDAPAGTHPAAEGLALAAPAGPEPQTTSLSVAHSWDTHSRVANLVEGNAVMLKSFNHGYLSCDANGDLSTKHNPLDLDSYVWIIHEVDLDNDGSNELQFELVDSSGPSGLYLKMNNQQEVSCDTISGIGDAAAWDEGARYSTNGTYYRRTDMQLINYKQGECLRVAADDDVVGGCSGGTPSLAFQVEVLK